MTIQRRWSFSLKTLFVGLTLLAIPMAWVAYQLNWIRERHAFFADVLSLGDVRNREIQVLPYDEPILAYWRDYMQHETPDADREKTAPAFPWSLRMFGEVRVAFIVIRDDMAPEWSARAKRLFPEAEVCNHF